MGVQEIKTCLKIFNKNRLIPNFSYANNRIMLLFAHKKTARKSGKFRLIEGYQQRESPFREV